MKTSVFSFVCLLFGISVFTISCTKDDNASNEILYPEMGYFGKNLLSESQFNIKLYEEPDEIDYSIRAELSENSSLEIVVTNVVHTNWALSLGSVNGWIRKAYNTDDSIFAITFIAYGPEVCDGSIRFGRNGSNTIEFYENNSSAPTRVKTITY